ncbi:hypothetical protein LUZ63_003896 [Rhynchospora breviuscula]|uniref:Pentatricopeptide repeat-containing protein n=1 Tax=Rhynchospora breviuscula TaxID=2022672 RepID=A0A9Q0D1I4_9POAL|nr:hypothetical protein LUZ63_003896 [Rhynchospora breviuscula]
MPRKLLPKQISTFIQTQTNIRLSIEAFISSPTPHPISTYRSLLQNLASHGELNQVDTVLSHMRQCHTDPSSHEPAYVASMRGYSRGARLQDAVDVFERMPLYDCEPSVVSYNVIMNALVDHGYFDQAHKVYMRMLDKGITADTCTHTVRIKAFCLTGRPHTAMRLLRNMAERGCAVSAVTYCTVVCGFYEVGFVSDARQVFAEMLNWGLFPDLVDFNKVLHVLCKKGDVSRLNEAVNLLENMHKSMTPDVTTYNTVINGLCKELRVSEAAKYLPKMFNSGCFPDSFTYNIIIDGYCKKGMVQDACELLKDAVFRGFVPDNVTYGSLINGLCEEGDFKRAVEFLNKSQANGFTPDIFMYNSLIKGLCRQGLVLQALEVLHAMPDSGCTPDIHTYNIVINGLCKMGNVTDAIVVLNDCLVQGSDPEDAYQLFLKLRKEERGFSPSLNTYNILINAYCCKLNLSMAEKVLSEMMQNGFSPDAYTYHVLIDGTCKTGTVEKAYQYLITMVDSGFVPTMVTFGRVINSLCVNGRREEAVSVIQTMVQKGWVPAVVSTILSTDKREIAAPKILVEELMKKGHITYHSYEVLFEGVRDIKVNRKRSGRLTCV